MMGRSGMVAAAVAAAMALVGVGVAQASPPETVPHNFRARGVVVAASGSAGAQSLLASQGGTVMTAPHVFVDFWGSPWNLSASDPSGEIGILTGFLGGLWGPNDTWSSSTTQYCQGVSVGTQQCDPSIIPAGNFVAHPASSPLVGTWIHSVSLPKRISQSTLAAEAAVAMGHYESTQGAVPASQVDIVVATPHGHNASGFGTQYCAWHSSTSTASYGTIAYTNLPYITDAGASCGANFNGLGTTAGITIVGGHEYAETVTDPAPNGGWLDPSGAENGDKCAWISSGQGAAASVSFGAASFPVQSLFSNNYSVNGNVGGCVTQYSTAASQS